MIVTGLATLIRFLLGIFLLQGVTALLVYTALNTQWEHTWPLFLLLGGSIGALVALWFSSIVGADRRHALSRVTERFSKEREEIRLKAEQQRTRDVRTHERQTAKVAKSTKAGGILGGLNLKSGAVVGGVLGVGVAMVVTQFVTLGLLTLTTVGGAALGYGVRARQEKLIGGRRLGSDGKDIKEVTAREAPLVLEGRARRSRAIEDG